MGALGDAVRDYIKDKVDNKAADIEDKVDGLVTKIRTGGEGVGAEELEEAEKMVEDIEKAEKDVEEMEKKKLKCVSYLSYFNISRFISRNYQNDNIEKQFEKVDLSSDGSFDKLSDISKISEFSKVSIPKIDEEIK